MKLSIADIYRRHVHDLKFVRTIVTLGSFVKSKTANVHLILQATLNDFLLAL